MKNIDRGQIDVLDQFNSFVLVLEFFLLEGSHELNEIEDDILSEKNFSLIEVQKIIAQHVPANRSSSSVD